MPKYYEDKVGDVCSEEIPIRRLVEYWFWKIAALVSARVAMCRRVERPELSMLSRQSSSFCRRGGFEEGGRRIVHILRIGLCC